MEESVVFKAIREKFLVFLGIISMSIGTGCCNAAKETMKVVSTPSVETQNDFYVGNRSPLLPSPFMKLPVRAINPQGWLRKQLELQADGLTGHLHELSWYCERQGNPWIEPERTGPEIYYQGASDCYHRKGWEKEPYWLRGFSSLGYILEDERIMEETGKWVDAILASQQEDGWFGPVVNKNENDAWPNMPMLNVLRSYYEFSGDKRVLDLMTRYFQWQLNNPRLYQTGWWEQFRAGNDMESVYWLYNQTGETWLLDLVHKIHSRILDWDTPDFKIYHGPNFAMQFREPAQYYLLTKNEELLRATKTEYEKVMNLFGQVPGGMYGADESARLGHNDPRQAAETCAMVESMCSFEILLRMLGEPIWADRCEEVAFNSLPASMSPDYRMLHYLTAPNMVQLDRGDKSPGLRNHGCHLAYDANLWAGEYHCCTHNVGMWWPYYTEHLWMATAGNGLGAVMYAPCEVTAKVGNGTEVTITETTDYPFGDSIELSMAMTESVHFPLYLRIPGWCSEAKVLVNGQAVDVEPVALSYVMLDRKWSNADKVKLVLPMNITVKKWTKNKDSVSVNRGPLTYSLKIDEDWRRVGGTDVWPTYEVYPSSPWNYGLVLNEEKPAASFEVVKKTGPVSLQPFDVNSSPIEIRARARKIPQWRLDNLDLVGELQESPALSTEPIETVTLIPMGSARLRISAFPTVNTDSSAQEWAITPPFPLASNYNLTHGIKPLFDGTLPANSGDHSNGVFAWPSNRKGTTEWVQYSYNNSRRVSDVEVYWYDDSPEGWYENQPGTKYRAPQSWRVLYKDGYTWKPVTGASEYTTTLDQFNRVTFDPVVTEALRLEVQLQPDFSAGIIEWKVLE